MIVFGGEDGSLKADLRALRFSDEVPVVVRGLEKDGDALPRHGMIQAAILGSGAFSVDSILTETITLAGAHAFDAGPHSGLGELRDVNGDRFEDLLLRFRAESLQVAPRDTSLRLWGRTPHFSIRGIAVLEKPPLGRGRASATGFTPTDGVLSLTSVNPSLSTLRLRFSLASASPARIDVYDVAGRRVADRELTGLGPGEHRIEMDPGQLRPGLYLIRLRQDDRQALARGLLIQ
jgi:hypothetical protein